MAMAIEMAMMVGIINTKPYSSTASDAMIAPRKKYTTTGCLKKVGFAKFNLLGPKQAYRSLHNVLAH